MAPLPGVGRNLIEHPSVSISCYLDRDGRLADLDRHHTQAQVRFSSRLEGCPPGDMCIAVLARSGWHALGQRVGSLYFFVNKAYSQGSVTLRSADPGEEPLVDFRMLSDRRDLERLRAAFRFVAEIATAPELDGVRTKIFPTNYSDRVRGVSRPGLRNAIQMRVLAAMLGALPPLRGWLIDTLVTGGVTLADLLADDATLDAYLNKTVAGVWHPVGTLPHGRTRSARRDDAAGPRARRSRLARVRRLGDAVDPVREHEHHDDHDRGADGGFDQGGERVARPNLGLSAKH